MADTDAPTGAYASDPYYQQLWSQINAVQQPGGQWTPNNINSTLTDQGQQFASMYQNLTGLAPTDGVMNSFYQNIGTSIINSPGGESGSNYASNQALDTPYIQNTYGPQIQQYQQNQEQNALNTAQTNTQNSINTMDANTQAYLTSPTAQAGIQGQLNNSGMLNSGAYSSTMAGLMSQGALQNENNAIQGLTVPAEQNILGMSSAPYANTVASSTPGLTGYGSTQSGIQDFNMESSLAQLLAQQGQPSTAQSILGMASGAAGGAGAAAQGYGAAKSATSYVCKELIKRGLLCDKDMDDFHGHIMPAMFKKGRAFWKYAMDGWALVDAVNARDLNWKVFKPLLFDRVMEEPDPYKAVDLYADACHQLCISAAPWLWDHKVLRTSFLDSLQFLPKLFLYTPFLKALGKCLRIKVLWIYDNPRCEVHR